MRPFSVEDRERVRQRVLELASSDERVVAAAVIGSLALGGGDRWSDLDLTFGVVDGTPVTDVLADWSNTLVRELDAVHLFDLPSGQAIYRVLLLPGCLQCDLSFAPASAFGAAGPKFTLLFGNAVERPYAEPPSAHELFGYAVHHALRTRFSIERGRFWQAAYWIGSLRDCALALACRTRGLPARYARGVDDLPPDLLRGFEDALVGSLDRDGLLRALDAAIAGLLRESDEVADLAARVDADLRALTAAWDG